MKVILFCDYGFNSLITNERILQPTWRCNVQIVHIPQGLVEDFYKKALELDHFDAAIISAGTNDLVRGCKIENVMKDFKKFYEAFPNVSITGIEPMQVLFPNLKTLSKFKIKFNELSNAIRVRPAKIEFDNCDCSNVDEINEAIVLGVENIYNELFTGKRTPLYYTDIFKWSPPKIQPIILSPLTFEVTNIWNYNVCLVKNNDYFHFWLPDIKPVGNFYGFKAQVPISIRSLNVVSRFSLYRVKIGDIVCPNKPDVHRVPENFPFSYKRQLQTLHYGKVKLTDPTKTKRFEAFLNAVKRNPVNKVTYINAKGSENKIKVIHRHIRRLWNFCDK